MNLAVACSSQGAQLRCRRRDGEGGGGGRIVKPAACVDSPNCSELLSSARRHCFRKL